MLGAHSIPAAFGIFLCRGILQTEGVKEDTLITLSSPLPPNHPQLTLTPLLHGVGQTDHSSYISEQVANTSSKFPRYSPGYRTS